MQPREIFKEKVNSLLSEGIGFDKVSINLLRSPCVYLFLKDDEVLYVGMSGNGVVRAFGRHRTSFMEDADELIIYKTKDIRTAKKAELLLIQSLKPKHNIALTDRPRSTKRIRELMAQVDEQRNTIIYPIDQVWLDIKKAQKKGDPLPPKT